MASPQIQNGYIQIANEIQDALCRINIPGRSRQVFDFIIRKTYGFGKRKDRIALSQFHLGTGLDKPEICRSIKKLLAMNLVQIESSYTGNIYSINKDYETWQTTKNNTPQVANTPLAKKPIGIGKYANKVLANTPHTINNITKDNMTKDKIHARARKVEKPLTSKELNEIYKVIDAFESVNVHWEILHESKKQYDAALRLTHLHGLDYLLMVINALPKTNELEFFPRIFTPVQLEDKWESLHHARDDMKHKVEKAINKKNNKARDFV